MDFRRRRWLLVALFLLLAPALVELTSFVSLGFVEDLLPDAVVESPFYSPYLVSMLWPASLLTAGVVLTFAFSHYLISPGPQRTPRGQARERNTAGLALFQQGGFVAAVAEFTEALRLDPNFAQAYVNRAGALWSLGKADEAMADLDTAIGLNSGLPEAYGWRSLIWLRRGDTDKALADCDYALKIAPGHSAVFANRGLVWAHKKDYDRALADFNTAIAHNPTRAESYATRAQVWLAKDEYDHAIADLTEALARGAQSAAVYRDRGLAWFYKGDLGRALPDLDEAVRRDPNDAVAHNNRGIALLKHGDYALAQAALREALRLEPRLPQSHKNLAQLYASCPRPEFRDGARAVAEATQALELVGWKNADWLPILAAAHAEAGNFAEAVVWQTKFLEQAPPEARAEHQARLDLYLAGRPYREGPAS